MAENATTLTALDYGDPLTRVAYRPRPRPADEVEIRGLNFDGVPVTIRTRDPLRRYDVELERSRQRRRRAMQRAAVECVSSEDEARLLAERAYEAARRSRRSSRRPVEEDLAEALVVEPVTP